MKLTYLQQHNNHLLAEKDPALLYISLVLFNNVVFKASFDFILKNYETK